MMKITMLTPNKDEPMWYRKAWKGVRISMQGATQDAETITVPTSAAIDGLREQSPGAAYLWSCCLRKDAPPSMTFPRGICELLPEPAVRQGQSGGVHYG